MRCLETSSICLFAILDVRYRESAPIRLYAMGMCAIDTCVFRMCAIKICAIVCDSGMLAVVMCAIVCDIGFCAIRM